MDKIPGGTLDLEALLSRERSERSTTQDLLDMNIVCQAIIEAEGDLSLVAERLLGNKNLQDQILTFISADRLALDNFAAKTRAFALIKTMSIFSALGYQVMISMPNLKPEESIKAFIKIADAMERMTKATQMSTTNNFNIIEAIMGQVPPHIAGALRDVIITQDADAD
jgi:hypothetical protein